jgi:hypothetical protein
VLVPLLISSFTIQLSGISNAITRHSEQVRCHPELDSGSLKIPDKAKAFTGMTKQGEAFTAVTITDE